MPWSPIPLLLEEGCLPQGLVEEGLLGILGLGQGPGVCSSSHVFDGVFNTQTVVNCCFV